jgi:hypothetical protein
MREKEILPSMKAKMDLVVKISTLIKIVGSPAILINYKETKKRS